LDGQKYFYILLYIK